jgi:succinate dehydrogenase / fumarate reductase membrane anchor subunit
VELYGWFFMRVSGVVLLGIAVFHLLYMHMVVGVENMDYDLIARRWANPGWRLFDLVLLTFALSHGTNGLRVVLDDYVPPGLANTAAKALAYVVAITFFLMGVHVLFTFQVPPGLG